MYRTENMPKTLYVALSVHVIFEGGTGTISYSSPLSPLFCGATFFFLVILSMVSLTDEMSFGVC